MTGPRFPAICEYDATHWSLVYIDLEVNNTLNLATSPKSDPHNWTAYASNPILSVSGGVIRGIAVIKDPDDGEFKVLYDTAPDICLATGSTLESLTKYSDTDTPVFSGQGSDWEQYVRHPALIKVGSTYHMYYDGRNGTPQGGTGAIGHATSSDLITWVRDSNNPVLSPEGTGFESSDVGLPCMAQINGVWRLFYAGYNGVLVQHEIGYANSKDGSFSSFYRNYHNPVIEMGASGWDQLLADGPALFTDGTDWFLYYSGRASGSVDSIGYATLD